MLQNQAFGMGGVEMTFLAALKDMLAFPMDMPFQPPSLQNCQIGGANWRYWWFWKGFLKDGVALQSTVTE